jgi:NADH dehydrogenase FAD-containing subunit
MAVLTCLRFEIQAADCDADIAQPVRAILSKRGDITVLLDEVQSIDLPKKLLQLS